MIQVHVSRRPSAATGLANQYAKVGKSNIDTPRSPFQSPASLNRPLSTSPTREKSPPGVRVAVTIQGQSLGVHDGIEQLQLVDAVRQRVGSETKGQHIPDNFDLLGREDDQLVGIDRSVDAQIR